MSPLRAHTMVAVLLGAVTIISYSGSLGNGFVWDDNFQIVRNPFLQTSQPLGKLFLSDVWGYMRGGQESVSNYYRPMQMLTYRVVYAIAGPSPVAFHAASILFNLLASFVAYLVMWQLTRRAGIAATAALLFAVHPIHSEAVLWISALTEVGCAIFYFFSFWLFLRATEAEPQTPARKRTPKRAVVNTNLGRRRWLILGACLTLFFALLWKEMALTFPVLVGAYVFFFSTREPWPARLREAAWRTLPFWGVIAVYAVLRIAVLGYFSRVQHGWLLSPAQYVANVLALVAQYWTKLVLPTRLNAFHMFHPIRSLTDVRVLTAVLVVGAGILVILFGLRRSRLSGFAAAWVFLTLAPVLSLQSVGENVFAERYLYIPSLGFALLVACAGAAAMRCLPATTARAATASLLVIVSMAAIAQTRGRAPDWRDDRALYESSVRRSPDSALMHNSLAQVFRDNGELEEAEREYRTGLALAKAQDPPNAVQIANGYLGLAGCATRRGQLAQGLGLLDRATAEGGADLPSLHSARGVVLLQMGRVADAEAVLQETLQYFPSDEVVLNALGVIAMMRKDYGGAIDYFRQTVQIYPTYADGFNNLGRAYTDAGRVAEAIPNFERAVQLQPGNPQFLTNFGVALARQSRYAEARAQLERALAIAPSFPAAVANLQQLDRVQPQAR